ncbi:GNAT family N-acetyltransferase [Clostridium uliginosum]|uniref:Spore coat polysaccharide biosynthesis protein SpsF n=1 Tax=Clostridium uliginosum TaxID=119641 RepID=A0A1I1KJ41_9CLOT|nr:spore coat polysaccharide biosynthesis protein SpsF [Clostridium uliginosum]
MKVVCIIQARVGSTRLPGKVLKQICGKTVLEHDIERLKKVRNIDEIVIATTLLEKDNAIVDECERLGVSYFRGSEQDVLSRYYYAAKENKADVVVRVTSDCPLTDSKVSEKIIDSYLDNKEIYDYVSNTIERTYPRGLDTEVFSFNALERAFNEAISTRDREHVTPYIWDNNTIFNIFQYKNKEDYSNLRWTLDTEEDYKLISIIYKYFCDKEYFCMEDIIALMKEKPELEKINIDIEQKKIDDDLILINANKEHCKLIYEWRNDKEVRKNSFDTAKISYEEHVEWYAKKLNDSNCKIYLLANSNKNIGVVRLELKDGENTINYNIEKNSRGKGYGYKILLELEKELIKNQKTMKLTAYVKSENIFSLKIFNKLNYEIIKREENIIKLQKVIGK